MTTTEQAYSDYLASLNPAARDAAIAKINGIFARLDTATTLDELTTIRRELNEALR